jgi:hypothetical protein
MGSILEVALGDQRFASFIENEHSPRRERGALPMGKIGLASGDPAAEADRHAGHARSDHRAEE